MSKEQKTVLHRAIDPGAEWRIWEGLPRGGKAGGGGKPSTGTKGGEAVHLPADSLDANGGDGEKGGKVLQMADDPGAEWRIWEGLPRGGKAGRGGKTARLLKCLMDPPSAINTASTNPFAPPGTGGSGPTPRHGTPVRGHGRTSSKGNAHNVRGHMRKG